MNIAQRLLRFPLRAIPRRAVVPILSGPARGMRWVAGASTHGCWLGTYERETAAEFARRVRPGMTVYDIGANAGYYTLAAAALVGRAGHVVAFEPVPRTLHALRRHVDVNGLGQVVLVVGKAVADRSGRAAFGGDANEAQAHFTESGELIVETVTIDALLAAREIPPPNVMKIDVEGAAALVLTGARETILTTRPCIFIETHVGEHGATTAILEQLDYSVTCVSPKHGDFLALPN
jgi:FkbM family methyltransferase